MTELDTIKKVVVLRHGLCMWVTEEQATKLEEALAAATKHMFVRINGTTVSSMEIEGIYSREKYDDLCKVKQGMYQCQYGNWHNKGKRECECSKEHYRKLGDARRAREKAEEDREPTPEERERARVFIKSIGEDLKKIGVLPKK